MEIGNRLHLFINDAEDNQMVEYRCTIISKDNNYLFIDYPINKDTQRTSYFPTGTVLLVQYIDKDKNLYQFKSKIKKKVTLTMPALAIDVPEKDDLKQIQRREFVRTMTAIDVAIHSKDHTFSPFTTVTNDISGGGISAVIPPGITLEKGEALSLWMVLHMKSGIKYIQLEGEAIHMNRTDNGPQTSSIKFTSITDQSRQTIIQFVFDKQREARQKELI